jgi:hypothetical protein
MKTTAIAIAALIGTTSAFAPQGNVARCKFWKDISGARPSRPRACNKDSPSVTRVGRVARIISSECTEYSCLN